MLPPNYDPENAAIEAVHAMLGEIIVAAKSKPFIFRGEPKYYDEISSSLYREFKKLLGPTHMEGFDMDAAQFDMLDHAARYVENIDQGNLLSQLQHYGHPTNLIDFTPDVLIALYFACDGEPDEDGRLILLDSENASVYRGQTPTNRVRSQKSVFVGPPSGVIEPDQVFRIPKELKPSIIVYLNNFHHIAKPTIYDDIHGYIKNANLSNNAYARYYAGRLLLDNGRFEDAVEQLSYSIRGNSDRIHAWWRRGIAFARLERFDDAIRDFSKVIEMDPDSGLARMHRGSTHLRSGKRTAALVDFGEAIRLGEMPVELHIMRSNILRDMGDVDGALKDANAAVELDPQNGYAIFKRGEVLWAMDDHVGAKRDFEAAVKLDDCPKELYHSLADLQMLLGEFEGALLNYRKSLEMDVVDPARIHCYMGLALIALERFPEAREELAVALELEFSSANVTSTGATVSELMEAFLEGKKIPDDLWQMLDAM